MSSPIDLRELLKPYKGQWVALSHDEKQVLGHGKSLEEAIEMAKNTSSEKPVLIKVPSEGEGFLVI